MKKIILLFLASTVFAGDPQILNMIVDTTMFTMAAKTTRCDTVKTDSLINGRIDSTTTIVWRGAIIFSCLDPDDDSLGVFIDAVVGNDTIPADSIWGVTRATSGNDRVSAFSFHSMHKAWKGEIPAKIRLGLDDVFMGFNGRPRITVQPANVSTLLGLGARFSVVATGNPAPVYQWFFNDSAVKNATAGELLLPSVDTGQSGTYSVVVKNGNGSVMSDSATLAVNYAPIFTLQPRSDTVDTGKSLSFSASAYASPALTCQWQKNGVNITGATQTTFSIPSVGTVDSGVYTVVMSNIVGNTTSVPAVLTVNYAPRIVMQPVALTARGGQSAMFEVKALGRPAPTCQWLKNGAPVAGQTYATYSIPFARMEDTGAYSVVAANRIGSVISVPAVFTLSSTALKTDSMIVIAGGTFLMGKTDLSDPVHEVTLTAFKMSNTLVTQGEYARVTGVSPFFFKSDTALPVENVTWFDAVLFCNKKSKLENRDTVYRYTSISGTPFDGCIDLPGLVIDQSGNGYRLPTEAEYEYACRAGTMTDYYWGGSYPPLTHDDSAAIDCNTVWSHNSSGKTQPVGSKQPNPWGLYDITGETWQWLGDWYGAYKNGPQTGPIGPDSGFSRTVRGGSWSDYDDAGLLRSMVRNGGYFPDDRSSIIGFRVVVR